MTKSTNVRNEVANRAASTIQDWQNVASEAQRINAAREETRIQTINEIADALNTILDGRFLADLMAELTQADDYRQMGEIDENATAAAEELVNSLTTKVSSRTLKLFKEPW